MKTKSFFILCILIMRLSAIAQVKIGDNATTVNSASLLELETTNKGFVLPRISVTSVNSSAPLAAGLLTGTVVYNTNSSITGGSGTGIYYWDGSKWNFIANTSTTANYWSITGNSGTSAASNFIGTTDAIDFIAKTNNAERVRITSSGNVGIGIANPSYKLAVLSASNPLYLSGVQATSTFTADSVLTINAGIVKKTPYSSLTGNFWNLTGNSGTSASSNFIGTSDAVDFVARTNNVERLRIASSGNVGIGIANPSYKLSVLSASNPLYLSGVQATSTFTADSVLTINAGIVKKTPYSSLTGNFWNLTGNSGTSASSNYIGTSDAVDFVTRTNNLERFRVTSGGNVGIGMANPSYKLSVLSSSDPLYLSGVQATSTFTADSVLTINAGVVKKTPYSSLTGNFWSITGNSGTSYSTNFLGTTDNVSLRFRTNNTEQMIIDSLGHVGIGSSTFSTTNPGKLLVDYGATTSNTIVNLKGNTDNYFQINLQNQSSGTNSSSDYVATASDGTDSTFYIDMGINGGGYVSTEDNWGGPHDGYLYTYGRNLVIGSQTTNGDVLFLLGGGRSKYNAVLRLDGATKNLIVGTGENQSNATGNTIRGPNGGNGTNIAGGSLTLQGGSSNGNTSGGNLNLYGGGTVSGTYGSVNINASTKSATNINTGTSASNITMGGNANNILLPKFNTVGGLYYTSVNTGQISTTGANMTWDSINNRLGIGISSPGYKLSVLSSADPLYLSGVQATSTFSSDSILTINAGVVKKSPYSSLAVGNNWSVTGNAGTTAGTNFLGTTDGNALMFKVNNTQAGYLGLSGSSYATSLGVGASGSSTGFQATAIGSSAQATANDAIALGYNSTASIQDGIAIGNGSQAKTNNEAIAIGHNATASAYQSIALGVSANASTNNQTIAIGTSSTATGYQGIAIGNGSTATTNNNAMAVGVSASATGYQSTAIGNGTSAAGQSSTAIGNGATTSQANALILGNSSVSVGIGTSTPAQGLEVSNRNILISNNNNTAGQLQFMEPSTSGSNYVAFKAPVTSANTTYTLPSADGVADQVLSTNGSGTLSWASNVVGTAYSLNSSLVDPTSDIGGTYAYIGQVAVPVASTDAFVIQGYFSAQPTNPSQTGLAIRITRSTTSGSGSVGTIVAYSGFQQHDGNKYASVPIYTTESGLTAGTWYYKIWATSNDATSRNYNLTVLKVH